MTTTFSQAMACRAVLEANVARLSAALLAFPRGPMGLTPDGVKASQEFMTASADFNVAFHRLRTFNASFAKAFAKEIRDERRAQRQARTA